MCSPAAFGTVFGIASGITFGNTSGPSAPGIRPFTEYHRDIFGFIYAAAFAMLETCLPGCLSGISAPSTRVFLQHLRDHRRVPVRRVMGPPCGQFRRIMGPPPSQHDGATRKGGVTQLSQGHGASSDEVFAA